MPLSVPGPGHFKLTSDFASIGLGFGTALGVARARPDETTVLVIGDGGFLMTMGELETVVRGPAAGDRADERLRLRGGSPLPQDARAAGRQVGVPDVDYALVAEAFGFQAATIRTLEDLQKIAPLLARPDGPVFLTVSSTPPWPRHS